MQRGSTVGGDWPQFFSGLSTKKKLKCLGVIEVAAVSFGHRPGQSGAGARHFFAATAALTPLLQRPPPWDQANPGLSVNPGGLDDSTLKILPQEVISTKKTETKYHNCTGWASRGGCWSDLSEWRCGDNRGAPSARAPDRGSRTGFFVSPGLLIRHPHTQG